MLGRLCKSKMKVAIIAPTLSGRGGEETVISKIKNSCYLKSRNVRIDLLLLGKLYHNEWLRELDGNINISDSENNLINFFILTKLIIKEKYDIVLCLTEKFVLYTYMIRKMFCIKHLVIFSWIHFNLDKVNTKFMHLADYHLAISTDISKQLQQKKIAYKSKIYVIYNPVDRKRETVIKRNKNEMVYIGRITFKGQKNVKELIDGLTHCTLSNWHLSIIGDGADVPKCKKYIQQLYPKFKSNFSWLGWSYDPWLKIKSADCLILTSKYEGLPMVLLEAISRGLPCLSSNCVSGPDDIIKSKINGELYQLGNLVDFDKKLNFVLNYNFNKVKMKESLSQFYLDNYMKNLYRIFNKTCKNKYKNV